MKVFTVMRTEGDEMFGCSFGVKVFATFEGAKAYFYELVNNFKECNYWDDEDSCTWEEKEEYFDWSEIGSSDVNYFTVIIEEQEVI